MEGKGDVEAEIQMQSAPYQDGATFIDAMLESRFITLNVNIVASTRDDLSSYRQELASVFNPKLGIGTLIYENGNTKRKIEVVASGVPVYPVANKGKWWQRVIINLVAPSASWADVNPISVKLEDYTGNFRFPFRAPGIRFAVRGDRRTLINIGDSPAPFVARFVGSAINPVLKNETTGEFIKINCTITDEFELHISTVNGDKYVKLVDSTGKETNVFNYIDLSSAFFKLQQGVNVISFITEGGKPDVYIDFYNQYLSV